MAKKSRSNKKGPTEPVTVRARIMWRPETDDRKNYGLQPDGAQRNIPVLEDFFGDDPPPIEEIFVHVVCSPDLKDILRAAP